VNKRRGRLDEGRATERAREPSAWLVAALLTHNAHILLLPLACCCQALLFFASCRPSGATVQAAALRF